MKDSVRSEGAVLQRIPTAAAVTALAAIGLVAGITMFPMPPYDNVPSAAMVTLITVFGGTFVFLEVKTRAGG